MVNKRFAIFGSETVGRIFLPDGLSYTDTKAIHISPVHGRSIAIYVNEYEWILVKGGGWNYKGPQVYISNKDDELIFGLYPLTSAKRELAVSQEIEKISNDFPKVLYYKKICEYNLPKEYDFLKTVKFKNGNYVEPCLLYTKVKCPYRVADLPYLSKYRKERIIANCCSFWGVSLSDYTKKFTETLALHVGILHKNKFINDTLDYSNVTLLGEVVDYEWVTAPNIKLIDGTYGLELTKARKEKELMYGTEVCLQLKALLNEQYDFFSIYRDFVFAYEKENPDFVSTAKNVQKILKDQL